MSSLMLYFSSRIGAAAFRMTSCGLAVAITDSVCGSAAAVEAAAAASVLAAAVAAAEEELPHAARDSARIPDVTTLVV